MTRPDWDSYFLGVAKAISARADCQRRSIGAVIVDSSHKIIGTGYNGTRSKAPGCLDGACPRGLLSYDEVEIDSDYNDPSKPGYCISTHAEMNAILYAGRNCVGATMYITDAPCPACFKAMFNAGFKEVVYASSNGYRQQELQRH